MRAAKMLLLAGLLVLGASRVADAAKLALVIGNARYPDNEFVLNDVANDTQEVTEELKRDGFVVDRQSISLPTPCGRRWIASMPASSAARWH